MARRDPPPTPAPTPDPTALPTPDPTALPTPSPTPGASTCKGKNQKKCAKGLKKFNKKCSGNKASSKKCTKLAKKTNKKCPDHTCAGFPVGASALLEADHLELVQAGKEHLAADEDDEDEFDEDEDEEDEEEDDDEEDDDEDEEFDADAESSFEETGAPWTVLVTDSRGCEGGNQFRRWKGKGPTKAEDPSLYEANNPCCPGGGTGPFPHTYRTGEARATASWRMGGAGAGDPDSDQFCCGCDHKECKGICQKSDFPEVFTKAETPSVSTCKGKTQKKCAKGLNKFNKKCSGNKASSKKCTKLAAKTNKKCK